MVRPTALAVLFVLLQIGSGTRVSNVPIVAEYPPQDSSLAFAVQAGNTRAAAAAGLRDAPADVVTLRTLWQAEDITNALRSLRLIVDSHPERIPEAADALREEPFRLRGDDEVARRNKEEMRRILADARAKLQALPREDAARAERTFIMYDGELAGGRDDWTARLRRFVETYRGTRAALLTEVDLISSGRASQAMFDALDRFMAEHRGTEAAAKALFQKGFQLHSINTLGTMEPRGADPTSRFLRVLEIVRELTSGRYPASEWTERAPSLIVQFFIPSDARIAPENLDLLVRHFTDAARPHFVLASNPMPDRDRIGYLTTGRIGELYARKGERVAGVERTLDDLERTVKQPDDVRLLRGLFYLRTEEKETPEGRQERLDKARAALRSVSTAGVESTHRRAFATLAALEFQEGQNVVARPLFEEYARRYPESPWTWVARIRIGQCLDAEGKPEAAAAAYRDAAERHADMPMARVLGAEYAARASELAGDLDAALVLHRRALAGWDNAFGLSYSSYPRRASVADPFVPQVDPGVVRKDALGPRIEQLARALQTPGAASLERARALVSSGRYDEAVKALEPLLRGPSSPLLEEARRLANLARIEGALARADGTQQDADRRAALALLDGVAEEAGDPAATVAAMMRSALLLLDGRASDAESRLGKALENWSTRQPVKKPSNPLEMDVARIRRAVFLPRGGGIFGTENRWNAFRFSGSNPPFMLVNSDLRVKLHDGEAVAVSLSEPIPEAGKLLFFDTATIDLLERMLYRLGGTKRREPGHVMETPNQPVGDSMRILQLWQRFFPARPGHWGGWELETYPVITEISFTNVERTRASAKVTIGYSGCTVELEKEQDRWIPRRLTNHWIT